MKVIQNSVKVSLLVFPEEEIELVQLYKNMYTENLLRLCLEAKFIENYYKESKN
jgi:hypothetical protein